jgi:uncharacterized protein YndB with AHSA1/START domain
VHIDVASQVGVVKREVAEGHRDGQPTKVAVAARTYDAELADVWDALTTAERIPRWLLPVSGDLRLGGRYQLEGNAGGEILVCEPPRHLAVTWEYGGDVSWVEVWLDDDPGGGTHLRLEHTAQVDDERWAQYGPGAVGVGWDLALLGLAEHLATGEAAVGDPLAFLATPEARDFMTRSSEDWCRASIAAGTPEADATAAAARTTAAYTGSDEEAVSG